MIRAKGLLAKAITNEGSSEWGFKRGSKYSQQSNILIPMSMMHIHGEVHPVNRLLPIGRVQRDYQDVPISMDTVYIHGWHGPMSRM